MIMMKYLLPSTYLATGLLLSSSFLSASALEVTAGATDSNAVYNSLLNMSDMRIQLLRQKLEDERQARIAGDADVRATLKSQLDAVDARVVTLDTRAKKLSSDVDLTQANFLAEVAGLKKDAQTLRNDMNARMAELNVAVANLRNYMNVNVNNLQAQINNINASINDLNGRMASIRSRLANLENFASYLSNRVEQLRACFANGSCVAYIPPRVQTTEVSLYAGNSGYSQATAYLNTGLTTSQWQFCALSSTTNQSRRDFRIYESGGYWWLANEMDNYWFGDEEGNLTARCMRVY